MVEDRFRWLKEEKRKEVLREEIKAEIAANPISEKDLLNAVKSIKKRVENIEKLLGLQ
jgi:hypothetical protein